MKKGLKIAIIGAGSTYTPELINGFISRIDHLKIDNFCFMDINKEKMSTVASLCERMLRAKEVNCKLIQTEDLKEALIDADYVVTQIRVGQLDARIKDEKIPLKYNLLGQETTGVGGFMKAMRTLPVMMNIARQMESLCPDAWLINFTNPSGIITEALINHTSIKMIGLCNGPINMVKDAKQRVPATTKHFDYDFVGLNHLCWITSIYADGKEILKEQLTCGMQSSETLKNVPKTIYEPALLDAVKGLPIPYLNYYYLREEQIQKCQEADKTRGEICKEIEIELLELYKDPNIVEKPAILDQRGGALYSEAAVALIDAIENDKNEIHIVNAKNNGGYSFMDKEDIVEIKCVINKQGAKPLVLQGFDDPYIIGMMRAVKAYEKLAVKAGVEGDYSAALSALMVHPLIGDYHKAKVVLDEMLEAHKPFLPQFYK